MKKLIPLLLTLAMIATLSPTSIATEDSTDSQRLSNEIAANAQYQLLQENLSCQLSATIDDDSEDYYGGAYLNEDGNLVVCITENSAENREQIQEYTDNEQIIIETVDYTYADILQEQNEITERIELARTTTESINLLFEGASEAEDALNELIDSIRCTYIDEERNTLVVEIEDISYDKIIVFSKYFSDEDFIEFEEGYATVTTSSWKPGRKIYTTSALLSTGYPVYFTDSSGQQVRGFITAGHAYDEGDVVYRSSGGKNKLGVCVASAFSDDTDAALIQITDDDYEISTTTYYGGVTISSNSFSVPVQGTTIYKEGEASGKTSGTVTSTSTTVYYSEATITSLLKTTALNLYGDSGGVAYVADGSPVGSMSGSSYSGSSLTEDTFTSSYICKVACARSALNCNIWSD